MSSSSGDVSDSFRINCSKIILKQVEVISQERKWILHLSTCSKIDPQFEKKMTELLRKKVSEKLIIEFEFHNIEREFLEEICINNWSEIIKDLSELLPSLKGWVSGKKSFEAIDNRLTFYVSGIMGMEYVNSKKVIIENYFYDTYTLEIKVCCEVLENLEVEDICNNQDFEEQKYVEEILAAGKKIKDKKEANPSNNILLGRDFKGEIIELKEVTEEDRQVIIQGEVCESEVKQLKSGRNMLLFGITDRSNSLPCKVFLNEGEEVISLNEGDWLKMRGPIQYDKFSSELTFMPRDIVKVKPNLRLDTAKIKRVELHLHTKMSEMDGVSSVQNLVKRAGEWGHEAIAITDHGVVQAFPDAYLTAKKYGIKVIFGMEGYLVNEETEEKKGLNRKKSYHVVLLAKNKIGLQNLYKLVTKSHLEYFYRRPRIPKVLLKSHRDGLIIGSACEAGELIQAILEKAEWERLREIASFYDYLEIQPLGNNDFLVKEGKVKSQDDLIEINRTVLKLGKELSIPVVATCDVHFMDREDEVFRRILMAGKGFSDADNQPPLFFRTTEEMLEEFSYLGEDAYEVVVENTRKIAEQIEQLKPFPDELFDPKIEGAEEKIKTMSWERAHEIYGNPLPDVVKKALEKELNSIIGNGFSVLYYIAHLLVKKSNQDGYLVGSRGSVGSSLVATFTGITEVNPLPPHYRCPNSACLYSEFMTDKAIGSGVDLPNKICPRCGRELIKDGHDIPFETFLGFKGDKVPDIDLNFSGEYQAKAHRYTEEIFGKENVFKAGTISTVAEKTAFGFAKNYLDERNIRTNKTELQRLVNGCAGVKRTTGQHPGGLMVIPKECNVYDFTPLQRPANDVKSDIITTHFDYHSISGRLVKLDILGHDDPTSIKMLEDLTGIDAKKIRLDDKDTISLFSSPEVLGVSAKEIGCKTGTLGIPEFGTKFVRQMLEDIQPKTFSHLVRISGLSHGTNVWLGNAQDLILNGIADISQIIACRDDIMLYLIIMGLDNSHAFNIMENVRKGKGLKTEDIEAMQAHNVPNWYIESCQKIKYMFPKAHAVAYVTMAFRIAWFKINYPEVFYATFFTVRADEFDADIIIGGLDKCKKVLKEIDDKGLSVTQKEKNLHTILEIAIEMYCRNIKLRRVNLWESDAEKFLITKDGLLPPFSALQGLGDAAAKSLVDLRNKKVIKSIEDLRNRGKLSKTVIEVLQNHGCLSGLPEENQLSLF
ncbi:MAG: PolC-type DNA polymerase III [Eubacteriales bacterium]